MDGKEKKATVAAQAFERAMLRRHGGNLSDSQLEFLMTEARTQLDWVAHVDGIEGLDLDSLCAGVERSETGRLVLRKTAAEPKDTAPDVEAETAGMTRAERINWARRHGLG